MSFTTRSRTAQGTTTPKQRALYGCLDRGSASSARCRSSPSHAAVTGRHRPTARPRRLQRAAATQHRTRRCCCRCCCDAGLLSKHASVPQVVSSVKAEYPPVGNYHFNKGRSALKLYSCSASISSPNRTHHRAAQPPPPPRSRRREDHRNRATKQTVDTELSGVEGKGPCV